MTAAQLMAELRTRGCAAPILLLTGSSTPEARHVFQQADAYLMKPYDTDAVLGAVRLLLNSATGSSHRG